MASNRLGVIIFGATGFTGKHTVLEAVKLLGNQTWGIAGRSQNKLQDILKEVGQDCKKDLSNIPVIVADVKDENSLKKMAERAEIIVNCCGPFYFHGEPVVKACINAGTHHVDVSGEPYYMERMQLQYNDLAREKGVYVVSGCGFYSIPAEMGVQFFEKQFDGEVNSIETYLEIVNEINKGAARLNYGTWESAVYSLSHADELREINKKLYKEPLPSLTPKQKTKPFVHKSDVTGRWCLPFFGSDTGVILRSQHFLYENEKKRPIQIQTFMQFESLFKVVQQAFFGIFFVVLSKFSSGQKLLLRYPKFFSCGLASHESPPEEAMKNTKFSITFSGEGWPKEEKLSKSTDNHTTPPTKKLITRVSGTNPEYGATCVTLLSSAITILKETDKLPGRGGVLPPGACFAKTDLISILSQNGFKFEVLSSEDKSKTN